VTALIQKTELKPTVNGSEEFGHQDHHSVASTPWKERVPTAGGWTTDSESKHLEELW